MILVDTSVWVDHLRSGSPDLVAALDAGQVWTHPFVLGEIACGTLRARREILLSMGRLPTVPRASESEALALIERHGLMGRGIGYIEVHLLASVLLEPPVRLWTRDRRLSAIAAELNVKHELSA
jgi:predicted nucleic acid-binding protein